MLRSIIIGLLAGLVLLVVIEAVWMYSGNGNVTICNTGPDGQQVCPP